MSRGARKLVVELPDKLLHRLDDLAQRTNRSKSWMVREAVSQWMAEEQRRHDLTLEALKDVDEGRTIPHEEVLAMMEQRRRRREELRSSLHWDRKLP
jgi:predicted transcriptional regulator